MTTYVALLRGINVGGNSLIKMAELKTCFEGLGLVGVSTYIASGNVIFSSPETDSQKLVQSIEASLKETFTYDVKVVLRTSTQLQEVIDEAPKGFGSDKEHKYNVAFIKEPLTPEQVLDTVELREGVDEAYAGPGVMYYSTVWAQASKSRIPKLVGTPVYQSMTVRTWNTVEKLVSLTKGTTR
jgi:uncharacterized protein (DUF1697 family)